MTKIFKLNKNLFKVGDNHVCVEENPRVGDWVLEFQPNDAVGEIYYVRSEYVLAKDIQKKIVFSTQFIHESITVLNIESEEVIGKPLEDYINEKHTQEGCIGFIAGYQKAKETFKYTEEDLIKSFQAGMNYQEGGVILYPDEYGFIQSLQQPKEIKSIEIEYSRVERIEKLLLIPLERLSIMDNLGDKKCKNCNGHGCVDTGNEFGCTIDYCESCYPAETPITLPNGKVKCKINY